MVVQVDCIDIGHCWFDQPILLLFFENWTNHVFVESITKIQTVIMRVKILFYFLFFWMEGSANPLHSGSWLLVCRNDLVFCWIIVLNMPGVFNDCLFNCSVMIWAVELDLPLVGTAVNSANFFLVVSDNMLLYLNGSIGKVCTSVVVTFSLGPDHTLIVLSQEADIYWFVSFMWTIQVITSVWPPFSWPLTQPNLTCTTNCSSDNIL